MENQQIVPEECAAGEKREETPWWRTRGGARYPPGMSLERDEGKALWGLRSVHHAIYSAVRLRFHVENHKGIEILQI